MKNDTKKALRQHNRKPLSNKGYALISALVLLAVFSIIGTSMVALSIRQTKAAANNRLSVSSTLTLDRAAQTVTQSITTKLNSDLEASVSIDDIKGLFGLLGEVTSFKLYINAPEKAADQTDEEYAEERENYAVTIISFSCSTEATDGVAAYTVSFVAVYGEKQLKVSSKLAPISNTNLAYASSITEWIYERTE